jgi:hypothetical protein
MRSGSASAKVKAVRPVIWKAGREEALSGQSWRPSWRTILGDDLDGVASEMEDAEYLLEEEFWK